jgi:hypothetical protein
MLCLHQQILEHFVTKYYTLHCARFLDGAIPTYFIRKFYDHCAGFPYLLGRCYIMTSIAKKRISQIYNTLSVPIVRKRTIPTEQPPLVGEVIANFSGYRYRVLSATDPHGR